MPEPDMLLRLLLAILLGGAIGAGAGSRAAGRAGLRTHILVCLGATIIMIASARMAVLSQVLPSASRVQVDPGPDRGGASSPGSASSGPGPSSASATSSVGSPRPGASGSSRPWGITIGQGAVRTASPSPPPSSPWPSCWR